MIFSEFFGKQMDFFKSRRNMPKLIFQVCSLTAHRNKSALPAEIFIDLLTRTSV